MDWSAGNEPDPNPDPAFDNGLILDPRLPEKDIFVLSEQNIYCICGLVCFQGRAEARGPAQASRLLTGPVILQQLPEQQITQHHSNTAYTTAITTRAVPLPPQLMARSCKLV